jgi:hypothetical protein
MNNLEEKKSRYMKDALPVRLGGLAANLARVSSFSKNPNNKEAVNDLLEESKYFIEWTAHETESDTAFALVQLQIKLALWQRNWNANWNDEEKRLVIIEEAKLLSNKVLADSGLLK